MVAAFWLGMVHGCWAVFRKCSLRPLMASMLQVQVRAQVWEQLQVRVRVLVLVQVQMKVRVLVLVQVQMRVPLQAPPQVHPALVLVQVLLLGLLLV